ncbi:hypothetical protein PybrP1_008884 [[Pythium] brassicae (nom. inval.)]|nr:hypothetical protein PybrP1_008884 [[Pythium] brassicae (nom. inval.)]
MAQYPDEPPTTGLSHGWSLSCSRGPFGGSVTPAPPVVNPWQLPENAGLPLVAFCHAPVLGSLSHDAKSGSAHHRLNAQQVAAVLQSFWPEVLQNNVKAVKKILAANHRKMDFNAARYRPSADGTALHLCAQHGFLAVAQLLLDFGLDINAQNKLGLTSLHIACKFQQADAVTLLLNLGARVDIPDHQDHTAFDVAPYAVLERCVLQPWRAKAAELEQVAGAAAAACDAAQQEVNAADAANERMLMVIADHESRAAEEQLLLEDECEREALWADRLRDAQAALGGQRAERLHYERLLVAEEEALAAMRRDELQRAERELADAIELLAQATALVEKTESELEVEQLVRGQQCGLLAAAREFPNDEDVQRWVIASICALADELGRERDSNASAEVPGTVDDRLDPIAFLFREESVRVVLDAMARFSKTHRVQLEALRCLTALMGAAQRVVPNEEGSLPGVVASLFLRCDVLAALRDALETTSAQEDSETFRVAFALLHHVVTHAGASTAVLQFCQSKRNQTLSLRLLRLLGRDCASSEQAAEHAASRLHAAHFLVVLAKFNVKKRLLDAGVVGVALAQIDAIVASSRGCDGSEARDDSDKAHSYDILAVRHFLATLGLLHSIASPSEQRRTGVDRAPCRLGMSTTSGGGS